MAVKEVELALNVLPYLIDMSHKHMWVDYDPEADVLYVSFERPVPADDAEVVDEDIIVRYARGKIVGVTVLNARHHIQENHLNVPYLS